jgi:hypothetical protein
MLNDLELIKKALEGDEEATRIYCGNYYLITKRSDKSKLFRFNGEQVPLGYYPVHYINNESIYDNKGFLLPKYWSLPRYDYPR